MASISSLIRFESEDNSANLPFERVGVKGSVWILESQGEFSEIEDSFDWLCRSIQEYSEIILSFNGIKVLHFAAYLDPVEQEAFLLKVPSDIVVLLSNYNIGIEVSYYSLD